MYSIVSFPQQLYSHYFPYSILGLQNTMSQMNSVPYPGYAMQNFFNQGGFNPYPLQMLQNYQQLPAPDENVDNQNKKWKSETIFLIFFKLIIFIIFPFISIINIQCSLHHELILPFEINLSQRNFVLIFTLWILNIESFILCDNLTFSF